MILLSTPRWDSHTLPITNTGNISRVYFSNGFFHFLPTVEAVSAGGCIFGASGLGVPLQV